MARVTTGTSRRAALGIALPVILGLSLPAGVAPAAAGPPALLSPPPAPGAQTVALPATVIRQRLVQIDLGVLLEADGSARGQAGQGGLVQLDLFDDASFTAVLDRVTRTSPISHTWSGRLAGIDHSSVVLAVERDVMAGQVALPGAIYRIRYAGPGLHAVAQVDQSRFPRELPPQIVAPADADIAPPDGGGVEGDDGSFIDVLIVYTAAARAAAGGTAAMNAESDLAVGAANNTYANSGITQRLRLLAKQEIVYAETGDMSIDLARLRNTADGFMDDVHAWRDLYKADLVALLVENGGGGCGIAYIMAPVSPSFASSAFSVTDRECASSNYTFAHELGHNMSARHDWYVDTTDNSPFTYNHGYVNAGARWRTVMAYNDRCADFGFNCTRLPYWSNPDLLYGGAPLGVPEGFFQAADNRKTLNNTAFTMANFRIGTVPPPPATTLFSPVGTILTTLPTFRWAAVSTATYYYLWVNGPAGTPVIANWFTAAEVGCGGGTGTCQIAPGTLLAAGAHRWWVQTSNATGPGPWSVPLDFTVLVPPDVPTLISPAGGITDTTPTYVWNAVPTATYYYLWVNTLAGTPVVQQWVTATAAGCPAGAGTCGFTPATALAQGTHRWWLAGWNAAGTGAFSAGMDFTVVPPPTTLIAPVGATPDNTPTYSWTAVGAASFYYLWVNGPAGTPVITEWFSAVAAGCGAGTGTCGVTPVTGLGGGTHRWWVATWNDISGYGPYSTPLDFTVIPPAGTALIAPSSAISDTTPTYSWTGVYGATYYYLFVRGPSGTAVFSQWYTAAAAGCPDVPQPTFPPPRVATVPTCSVTPTAALTGHGTHRWWVQTWNAVGLGPWSASLTFTLP